MRVSGRAAGFDAPAQVPQKENEAYDNSVEVSFSNYLIN